jgi:hypothetical protein
MCCYGNASTMQLLTFKTDVNFEYWIHKIYKDSLKVWLDQHMHYILITKSITPTYVSAYTFMWMY